MSFQTDKEDFNFMVSDIDFVVYRTPNVKWKIENLSNKKSFIIGFAVDGSALYKIDGVKTDIKKGDLLFFQKGQIHSASAKPENPWAYYSIAFDIAFLSSQSIDDTHKIPTVFHVKYFAEYADIFKKLNDTWNAKTTGYILKCRSLISGLLHLLITETQASENRLPHSNVMEKIKYYLIENYTKTFPIKELADIAGMSPSHFRLLFKKYTGQTVTQYQNRLKINKACDLLLSETCNITETAYSVGFSDIYYFSRLFKKIIGINPSAYAKRKL